MSSDAYTNSVENVINCILDNILSFYLHHTDNGKQMLKCVDAYTRMLDSHLRVIPKEKLLVFLEKTNEYVMKLATTINDIDQFTKKLDKKLEEFRMKTTEKMQYCATLPYRFKKWWYTHDINPFSAILHDGIMRILLPYTKTHAYKLHKAQQEIDRIEQHRDVHFGDIEAEWYAKRFPNGIQERDIINNSNSVISLLDNNIKQAISFNVFDHESLQTYHICIATPKNDNYSILAYVGDNIYDENKQLKHNYNHEGKLINKSKEQSKMNKLQFEMSNIIDAINNEFCKNNFDMNNMYAILEKEYHKQLRVANKYDNNSDIEKNIYVLHDAINMTTKTNNNKILIKKTFETPGFGYYPLSLETTKEKIKKILK